MSAILAHEEILQNILDLTRPYQTQKMLDMAGLKRAYLGFLQVLQPQCPQLSDDLAFYADANTEALFEGFFLADTRIPSESITYSPTSPMYPCPERRMQALKNGFYRLSHQDKHFFALFSLVMNTVFCTTGTRIGGSAVNSAYIGVMCAYLDMTADSVSIAELLIHEFTHNALFIDELRFGHYQNRSLLHDANYFVQTDNRGAVPFDRWFHALIVYAEIIDARTRYLGHEVRPSQHADSNTLIRQAREEIVRVNQHQTMLSNLSARGQALMQRCQTFFTQHQVQ